MVQLSGELQAGVLVEKIKSMISSEKPWYRISTLETLRGDTYDHKHKHNKIIATKLLFLAVEAGDPIACEHILLNSYHPIINERGPRGRTVLMNAAAMGHTDLCKLLLFYQADVSLVDVTKLTASDLALQAGHTTLAHLIAQPDFSCEGKIDYFTERPYLQQIKGSNLHHASLHHDSKALSYLLNLGIIDVNACISIYGYTPLHCLFLREIRRPEDLQNRKKCLELLLEQKNIRSTKITRMNHTSLLHFACIDDDIESSKILIHHDPSLISSVDRFGRTPMHWAAAFWGIKCLEYFYSLDATLLNKTDKWGLTPLDFALREQIHFDDTVIEAISLRTAYSSCYDNFCNRTNGTETFLKNKGGVSTRYTFRAVDTNTHFEIVKNSIVEELVAYLQTDDSGKQHTSENIDKAIDSFINHRFVRGMVLKEIDKVCHGLSDEKTRKLQEQLLSGIIQGVKKRISSFRKPSEEVL
jgi:ankyrin repeat protein